jgi:hypothetical protein
VSQSATNTIVLFGQKNYIELIADWETNGNGDGQRKAGEPDFGHVGETTLMDDDCRNFLRENKQHLLYFFHVIDACDLLLNTLTVSPNELTASSDGVPLTQERAGGTPTITNNKRARKEQQADDNHFKHRVSDSCTELRNSLKSIKSSVCRSKGVVRVL